jgi:hypothetical protein
VTPSSVKLAHVVASVVRGSVNLRVLCKGDSGSRCTGDLQLRPVGATGAASKRVPFEIATGKGKTLKLKLPAALARKVARRGDADAIAVIRFTQVDGTTVTVKRRITLLRPRR